VLGLELGLGSGVARVPCALGKEKFLRPPSTKLTEFEKMVQKCGRSNGRTFAVVTRFFFERNKTHL